MYMCKEHLLEDVLEGKELDELLKDNIISVTERFHGIILTMSVAKVSNFPWPKACLLSFPFDDIWVKISTTASLTKSERE